jgi:hypothetical protein
MSLHIYCHDNKKLGFILFFILSKEEVTHPRYLLLAQVLQPNEVQYSRLDNLEANLNNSKVL